MIVDELLEANFYQGWQERFENESQMFVTPANSTVKGVSDEALMSGQQGPKTSARDAWNWVYNNIEYKLSKEWKTPEQTIREGIGDCEDVTFLIASMLPNMGVNESKLVLGELMFQDGSQEFHTWNIVDGMVIDGTGSMDKAESLQYNAHKTYKIVTE
jgi:Transglutaminase-like enzymes, putative cysteine proteases